MKKLLSLTLCTILLLCSCNGNTTTDPDKTSETEETTLSPVSETIAETTEVTTTAKTETTTAETTTTTTENKLETKYFTLPEELEKLEVLDRDFDGELYLYMGSDVVDLSLLSDFAKLSGLFIDQCPCQPAWNSNKTSHVKDYSFLRDMKSLKSVTLYDEPEIKLSCFPSSIKNISIAGGKITEYALLPETDEFSLDSCGFSSEEVADSFPNLKKLTLLSPKVDYEQIARLSELEYLYIDYVQSDKEIEALGACTKLEELHLYPRIGDMPLVYDTSFILGLKNLRELYLPRPAISNNFISELEKALPDCELKTFMSGEWNYRAEIGERLRDCSFSDSVERFDGCYVFSQEGMTSEEAAELLLDKHIVCSLTYETDLLTFGGNPKENNLTSANHYIFLNSYSSLESFVRSTYVTEIAEDVLYNEEAGGGIYKCGENDRLLLDISKQGISIYPPPFSAYKLKILSENDDYMEFAVTWENHVNTYKAVRQEGEWRLCDVTPLVATKAPAISMPVFDTDLSGYMETFRQEFDYDFENDPHYLEMVKYYTETFGEEKAAEYSELVWDTPHSENAIYLGNENKEWIVPVICGFKNAQLSSFVRMFYFSDGKITGKGSAAALSSDSIWRKLDNNRIYIPTTTKGLAIYDTLSDTYSFITKDNAGNAFDDKWISVFGQNKDYIIFGNGYVFAYDIKSGEVFRLDGVNLCGSFDEYSRLDGNRLLYLQTYPQGIKSGIYDLEKREYCPLESYE
ncbi:MAG: hypothetical protein ACI4J7_10970 [Ruminiclostridium sp.]